MKFTDYIKIGPTWVLPMLGRYTVDMKCREFRKLTFNDRGEPTGIQFIPFETDKGDRMLAAVIRHASKNKEGRLWQEIINS